MRLTTSQEESTTNRGYWAGVISTLIFLAMTYLGLRIIEHIQQTPTLTVYHDVSHWLYAPRFSIIGILQSLVILMIIAVILGTLTRFGGGTHA